MSLLLLIPTYFVCLTIITCSADNKYSCNSKNKNVLNNNNWHMRGTSLGGWLVLEPWITPSLFYQFLGASKKWGNGKYSCFYLSP